MSVDRTDYLMLGVDVGFDSVDYDLFEAEICGEPNRRFDIVYDGMSGEYAIAGKIVACSPTYDGFEMTKITSEGLGVDKVELAAKLSSAFDKRIWPDELSLLLFSHFS